MCRKHFVAPESIVREIWSNQDMVLFIFAGAAAEFALNKAVDWLYFTGKIPKDPLGRLLSTVAYAQKIIFSDYEEACSVIININKIHHSVEDARKSKIPNWAYIDVLYMLMDYSIRAYELLRRKLTLAEKRTIFATFSEMGQLMDIALLPNSYSEWTMDRPCQLSNDLKAGDYTTDLFQQYRKHLGWGRYLIMKEVQKSIVPKRVRQLLRFSNIKWIGLLLFIYRKAHLFKLKQLLNPIMLPQGYKLDIDFAAL